MPDHKVEVRDPERVGIIAFADDPRPDLIAAVADLDYHRDRARAELDRAYRATTRAAAEAHLRLSSLHMRRMTELATIGSG